MGTTWRWPWRLESAKKCVTTYRSNLPALKMEGAEEREWKGLYCWIMEIRRKKKKRKWKEKKNKSPYVGGAWRKWRNEWGGERGWGEWGENCCSTTFSKNLSWQNWDLIGAGRETKRILISEELESKKQRFGVLRGWRNLVFSDFGLKNLDWDWICFLDRFI